MALTEAQKSEIRRHLGYPEPATALNAPAGPPYQGTFGQAGAHIGDRFTPSFYDLEYRLIDLPETGEVMVLGVEASAFEKYAAPAVALINVGSAPSQAGTLQFQIGDEPMTVATANGQTVAQVAANIISAISALTVAPKVIVATNPSTGVVRIESRLIGSNMNAFPVRAWGTSDVSLSVTDTATPANPTLTVRGGLTPMGPVWDDPSLSPRLPIYGHLPIIRFWEAQIPASASGMDTVQAGKFIQERHEYVKRRAAYISACRDMAQTLAVQYYGTKNYRGASRAIRVY